NEAHLVTDDGQSVLNILRVKVGIEGDQVAARRIFVRLQRVNDIQVRIGDAIRNPLGLDDEAIALWCGLHTTWMRSCSPTVKGGYTQRFAVMEPGGAPCATVTLFYHGSQSPVGRVLSPSSGS